MQKLYKTIDLANATGYTSASIKLWASNGWLKPCRFSVVKSRPHTLFFPQTEYDRLMNAVRESEGHRRFIIVPLNRTLHTAREWNAVTCTELLSRFGCCRSTLRKAMTRLGYPEEQDIVVLEEDVDEVKAMVDRVRQESIQLSATKRSVPRSKPGTAGQITLHIKGLAITLDKKDAEALAEEIISQI